MSLPFLNFKASSSLVSSSGFLGNPNHEITAINTSGGITCAQTSGQVPCFIHASASAITATGTTRPFEDLYYVWDFGDSGGTEIFTDVGSLHGGSVNYNTWQRGPEAAYCYRTPGTYTITLTIYGYSNASFVIRATKTQEIVVSAFNTTGGEYWADSAATAGTNAGTEANPFYTVAALNAVIASGSNKSVHVKKGSNFVGSTSIHPKIVSGFRLDTYGSGATPIFNIDSSNINSIRIRNEVSRTDMVISGCYFTNSGTSTPAAVMDVDDGFGGGVNTLQHIYFDNCEWKIGQENGGCFSAKMGSDLKLTSRFGFWNCRFTGLASTPYLSMAFFGHSDEWLFFIAGYVDGASLPGGSSGHHIYPKCQYHSLWRGIDFGPGENRDYCINLDYTPPGVDLGLSAYHLFADCSASGVKRFHDTSCGNNGSGSGANSTDTTRTSAVVCERNRIHGLSGSGVILFACAVEYTNRDNEVFNNSDGIYFSPNATQLGDLLQARIYRNKIHWGPIDTGSNLFDFDNALWIVLQEITDNIIVDERAASHMIAVPFTEQAGALIDRNQYWSTRDAGLNGWRDTETEKTFAQWQAAGFDLNGSFADPGWTDAANGDFS